MGPILIGITDQVLSPRDTLGLQITWEVELFHRKIRPVWVDENSALAHFVQRPADQVNGSLDTALGEDRRPAVIFLHGLSGTAKSMWPFASRVPADWFIFALEADRPYEGGGLSWSEMPEAPRPSLERFEDSARRVADFAGSLPNQYPVDPRRIALIGFSQGAALSAASAILHPDLFWAVVLLVGFVPELDHALEQRRPLSDLPVLMLSGDHDPHLPLAYSSEGVERLQQLGATVEFKAFSAGHKINSGGMRMLEDWLGKLS